MKIIVKFRTYFRRDSAGIFTGGGGHGIPRRHGSGLPGVGELLEVENPICQWPNDLWILTSPYCLWIKKSRNPGRWEGIEKVVSTETAGKWESWTWQVNKHQAQRAPWQCNILKPWLWEVWEVNQNEGPTQREPGFHFDLHDVGRSQGSFMVYDTK